MPGLLPHLDFKESDFAEIAGTLTALPRAVAVKIQGQAFSSAARIVVNEAKASAAFSDRTGRLRASIRVRRRQGYVEVAPGRDELVSGAFVSVVVGAEGARQAFLIEAGHGGPHPAPPHPFLGPAVEASAEEVRYKIGEVARRKIGAAVASAKAAPRTTG